MSEELVYHTPVMLKESVDGMQIQQNDICVDVTFGGGGHSRAAGCTLQMPVDEALEKVLAQAKIALNK